MRLCPCSSSFSIFAMSDVITHNNGRRSEFHLLHLPLPPRISEMRLWLAKNMLTGCEVLCCLITIVPITRRAPGHRRPGSVACTNDVAQCVTEGSGKSRAERRRRRPAHRRRRRKKRGHDPSIVGGSVRGRSASIAMDTMWG